jgi:hypothetical protein
VEDEKILDDLKIMSGNRLDCEKVELAEVKNVPTRQQQFPARQKPSKRTAQAKRH